MAENMEAVFGFAQDIEGFLDGVVRKATPVKMKSFHDFVKNLHYVDTEYLWKTMMWQEGADALTSVLCHSFIGYSIEDILENIDANNYKEILKKIYEINKIDLNPKTEGNGQEV